MLATPQGVFIGVSARTDAAGADALVGLLAEIGQRGLVVAMPPGVLHFKSDCALIGEETVPSTARLAASGAFAGFRVLILPEGEEGAANALRLGDEVLVSQGYPHTAERLAHAGFAVAELPIAQIAKIDAGLSCMSLIWCS